MVGIAFSPERQGWQMKALITGANGTLGKVLSKYLQAQKVDVVAWDRQVTPIDNYQAMEDFVRSIQPDMLFHLATSSQPTGRENEDWLVNYEWTSELAWICRQLNVRFIFTSSIMVFTDDAKGPFTLSSIPDAREGYGYEKWQAEQRTPQQNPNAVVARIGWQIGESIGGNHMLDYLERQMLENGEIRASTKWYPACSFLEDTAATLPLLAQGTEGLYLVDSNTSWTFYEIVSALNIAQGNRWKVIPTEDFIYEQRMIDERVGIPNLKTRLAALSEN
jgi:dTDP-4-dehydrorhamnose reductase